MTITFADNNTAKNLAGQPSFDPTKLATYAGFINSIVEDMLGSLEFASSDLGNSHVDFLDGGANYIKTKFGPIVTLTKLEYVDALFAVQSLLAAEFYINRDNTGIIEARDSIPDYGLYVQKPGCFAGGQANFKVTYLSGYGPSSPLFKKASLGATYLLASMILQDLASATDVVQKGATSWTVESVSKNYGSNGAFGSQIVRFWDMGTKIINDLTGSTQYNFQ